MFTVTFINNPKPETAQMSIKRRLMHTTNYLNQSQKCYVTQKNPDTKEYTLYGST